MKNVGVAFSTKDRTELSRQTIVPLLQPDKFDLWWIDGSATLEGQELPEEYNHGMHVVSGIRGGADCAIVYALTEMLKAGYEFIGLVENDVLLASDWFEKTMALFEQGESDGLGVGAVSARAYDDRILIQRDAYAVMFNLGAGMVVYTRRAVELILENYRTGWWPDVRTVFAQVSGVDVGRYACFRANAQWVSCDWGFDSILVNHGLASLALTPCAVEMIGQDPPLEEQGLRLADRLVDQLRNEEAFHRFARSTLNIRQGLVTLQTVTPVHRSSMNGGASLLFAHQLPNPVWKGDWRVKWTQGFGGFAWRADVEHCTLKQMIFGPCVFLVSGGERAAKVKILDHGSGYEVDPEVPPAGHGITQLAVPGGVSYREIEMTCGAGAVFYGIQCQEPQPISNRKFDYSVLPPV